MATNLLKIFSWLYVIFGAIALIPLFGWAISFLAFTFLPAPYVLIDFVADFYNLLGPTPPYPEWVGYVFLLGLSAVSIWLGLLGARAADWLKNGQSRGKKVWGCLVVLAMISGAWNLIYFTRSAGDSLIANRGLISFVLSLIFLALFILALQKTRNINV